MLEILNSWQLNIVCFLFFVVVFFQFYKLAVNKAMRDGAATRYVLWYALKWKKEN